MRSRPALTRIADHEPEPARLLLVEPHDVARLAVHGMLERAAPSAAVHSATCWSDAVSTIHRAAPNVLLLSSEAEEPDGELVERLHWASTKVVLMVRSADPERMRRLLRLPVSAVLREVDLSVPALTQVLGALEQEFVAIPRAAAQQLLGLDAQERWGGPRGTSPALTARELETLGLMAEGLGNRQIARKMGISEHGAKRHVTNVRAKLNCHNRTMAVATAMRLGLVAAEPR